MEYEAGGSKNGSRGIEKQIKELEAKRQKLLDAHVYQQSLDADLYRQEDQRLSQEIALMRIELHDSQMEEIDIEGVLGFAASLILDARRLWMEGTLDQRQRLQKVLFPKGVNYSNQSGFGTTETSLFFRWLALVQEKKDDLACLALSTCTQSFQQAAVSWRLCFLTMFFVSPFA